MLVTSITPAAEPQGEIPSGANKTAATEGGGLFAELLAHLALGPVVPVETPVDGVVPEGAEALPEEAISDATTDDAEAMAIAAAALLPEGMTTVQPPLLASTPQVSAIETVATAQPQVNIAMAEAAVKPTAEAAPAVAAPSVSKEPVANAEAEVPVASPADVATAPASVDGASTASLAQLAEVAGEDAELQFEEAAPQTPKLEVRETASAPVELTAAKAAGSPVAEAQEQAAPMAQQAKATAPEADATVEAPKVEAAKVETPAKPKPEEPKLASAPEAKAPDPTPQQAPQVQHRHAEVSAAAKPAAPLGKEVPVQDLAPAATQSVKHLLQTGEQRMQLRIHPESMGELQIEVTRSGGDVQVTLTATTQAARELLDAQTHHLREALVREGFDAPRIQVTQSNTGNSTGFNTASQGQQAHQQWQTGSHQQGGGQGGWQTPRYAAPASVAVTPVVNPARASVAGTGGSTLNVSV